MVHQDVILQVLRKTNTDTDQKVKLEKWTTLYFEVMKLAAWSEAPKLLRDRFQMLNHVLIVFCNASLFDTLNNDNGVAVAKTLSWPWGVRELRSSMQAVRDGEAYAQVIMRDVVQEADSMQCLRWIKTFHQKLVSIIDTVLAGTDACLKDLAGKVEQSLDSLGVESERADMENAR